MRNCSKTCALGAAASSLDKKKQETEQQSQDSDKKMQTQREAIAVLQQAVEKEKANHGATKSDGIVLNSAFVALVSKVDELQRELDTEKKNKRSRRKC